MSATQQPLAHTRWIALGGLVVGLLLLNSYGTWFVRSERTLYHADRVAYWAFSSHLAQQMRAAPLEALQSVSWSVANADLNLLPSVLIALSMAFLGDSRLVYVLSVLNIYGVATLLGLALLVARGSGVRLRSWPAAAALGCTLLLASTLWRPVLIGYLGLGGVALALVILALYLGQTAQPLPTSKLLLIGVLLALLVLFRRWYAFWALAFSVMVMVDCAVGLLRSDRSRRKLMDAARVPLWIGLACAATLAVLAVPVVIQKITTDYADMYSAYSSQAGATHQLRKLVAEYGLAPLALYAVAAALLVRWRETRRTALFLTPHLILTYLLMMRVQDHSPQHWYLYSPNLLALMAIALAQLANRPWRASARVIAVAVVALVGTTSALGMYWPRGGRLADLGGPLLSSHRVRPAVRHDLDEVIRLLRYLDGLTERSPGYIYALSNSDVLSEQTLSFANRSLGTAFRSPWLMLRTSHVDKRDGFPRGLLVARHVLVASPIQIHLRPEDQRVIVIPAEIFLEGRGMARAFQLHRQRFSLDNGVEILVFERARPFTPEEIEELVAALREAYPDRPFVWSP